MSAIIDLQNVCKYFPVSEGLFGKTSNYVKAVDDISFKVHEGEIIGIVGESGSGKTTLARLILSLTSMTSGNIMIDDVNINTASREDMKKLHLDVAVVFQDPASNLNPRETVGSSIMRPMIIHGVPKADAKKKAVEVLEMVKMDTQYLDSFPHQLSGGQLQRIAIARALALSPKIMILDEPTSALDVSVQAQILNLLVELQEKLGLTYIIITHDLNVIKYISDKIAVMYLGQLVEYGPADVVGTRPSHPYTKGLMDSAPILSPFERGRKKEIMSGDPGSITDTGNNCRFATRCKYATDECRCSSPKAAEISANHRVACFHPIEYGMED